MVSSLKGKNGHRHGCIQNAKGKMSVFAFFTYSHPSFLVLFFFIADPHPQVSDSVGIGWTLKICICNLNLLW